MGSGYAKVAAPDDEQSGKAKPCIKGLKFHPEGVLFVVKNFITRHGAPSGIARTNEHGAVDALA
jgi:hypothetical protein